MRTSLLGLAAIAATCAFFEPTPAVACGGCFVPAQERTVVTDHRMALSISTQQTVLWDQIRYSGDPAEFAWVLPVRAGAQLELSNDEWFTALDASTQPVVFQPNDFGGRAYGCALTGCASEDMSAASSAPGPGQVQIISQSVVGPYETVTLRATDHDALTDWLTSHAFSIPDAIAPTIEAYVSEGFDFIALRLRPDCGERSMQPVRIVTRGADPTLPLRMVAAGVGARVGITLYVIGEGRWGPQNFPKAVIEDSELRWDRFEGKSNYEELSQELMGGAGGRTWLTEYADKPQFSRGGRAGSSRPNPGLVDAYLGLCRTPGSASSSSSSSSSSSGSTFTPCPKPAADAGLTADSGPSQQQGPEDAGIVADAETPDAEALDAEAPDADADADASADAGETYTPPAGACGYLDDLDVALTGLHLEDVWVTRLRAVLPADALGAGDLRLEPAAKQTPVSSVHFAPFYADEDAAPTSSQSSCLSSPKPQRTFGSWALGLSAGILLVAWARRRRR